MNKSLSLGLMLLLGLATVPAGAQTTGDPVAGRQKAFRCDGCHGIDGWRSAYPMFREPKLGGQHAEYLASALKAYRAGTRAHPTMQAIAASLSDQDINDLAAFYSGHKNAKP